jgi:ribonucleoside-diphosphate reductase alpha chain
MTDVLHRIFTAGGRRGAPRWRHSALEHRMSWFHSLCAKRELGGRLRQFNLSLLITERLSLSGDRGLPTGVVIPLTQSEIDAHIGLDVAANDDQVIWRELPAAALSDA